MHLSQNIRHLRRQHNFTQNSLGEQIGVNGSQITKYEKGDSEPPVSKLIIMADLFKISLQDLVFTDLSTESPQYKEPEVPYAEQDEGNVLEELNNEMRKRLVIYEQKIKELDPELAKKWGIE